MGGWGKQSCILGYMHMAILFCKKMNLGPITKLKTPVAVTVTKCNVDKGFSLYPRAGIFPGRCLPRLTLIAQKKKGETWPKSFAFSSLEGHSDPTPLQVSNTITFRRTDCAALLNTPCFCGVSLN